MMGIVMSIEKKHMVVMKNDGTFIKVPALPDIQIGQEVSVDQRPPVLQNIYKFTAVAATIMLVFLGGLQVKSYYTPYGYVNIDINPSIELGYNKFERIISIKGINIDGQKVIDNIPNIKNIKIEDAVKTIVETANKDNYIKEDTENEILVSMYSPDLGKTEIVREKVNNSVNNYLNSQSKKAQLLNEFVSKEEIDRAVLQNISVGKLKLYEKAKQAEPNITIEDVKDKPVRDIIKIINKEKKDEKNQDNKKDNNIKKEDNVKESQTQVPIVPEDPKNNKESNIPTINKSIQNKFNGEKLQIPKTKQKDLNQTNNQQSLNAQNQQNENTGLEPGRSQSKGKAQERINKINERIKQIKENNFKNTLKN